MNVLQIISRLDSSDGAEEVISSTRFLVLNGHKVVVVSEKSELVKQIDEVGARHYSIPLKPNIFSLPVAVFKLARIIAKENINIVHGRDASSSAAAFFASRLKDRPLVETVYPPYGRAFFGKAQFWAKRVICSNETEARNLIRNGLVPKSKVRIVPPFVEAGEQSSGKPKNLLRHFVVGIALPLSSFEAEQAFIKTVSMLSRALSRLKVFAMDTSRGHRKKDSVEKLKLLIRRYSLTNIVTFLPYSGSTRRPAGLDLFAQINAGETAATRFLLQAEARGVPVVTTRTAWVSDYIEEGKTAEVCRGSDPGEISNAIIEIYRDEKKKSAMADAEKKFVREKFNIKKIMKETLILYEETASSINILVIKVGALGDAILVIPSLRAIRQKFPAARIKLLTGIECREIFANCPFIDEIIVCDFKGRDKGFHGLLRLAGALRSEDFDMSVDFQNNRRSHLLSFLSCAPKRYGHDNGKLSFLLNRKVREANVALGPIKHQSMVLGLLGIYKVNKALELWPTKEDNAWADEFLVSHWVKRGMKLVAFNISSSPRWITKLWPPEYFAEICNRLAGDFGIRAVLIGKKARDERIEKFLKHAKCKPIDALGKTSMPRLTSLIKKCDLLLSPDSAPLHVATSVKTPFVALFGPTDPTRHLVPSAKCVILKKDLECAPCYHTYCKRGYKCMTSITPDEVYEAMLKLLGVKK